MSIHGCAAIASCYRIGSDRKVRPYLAYPSLKMLWPSGWAACVIIEFMIGCEGAAYSVTNFVSVAVGDCVTLRKPHPCGGYEWTVVRTGADIGLKCAACGRRVMLNREEFERRVKIVRQDVQLQAGIAVAAGTAGTAGTTEDRLPGDAC